MKTISRASTLAGGAVLALALSIGAAWSDGSEGPAWLSNVADQKLIAVDGSTITLAPNDDKLTLTTVSASGAEQKIFDLMTDNMGTVTDGAARVTGFFRVTDTGIEAQFSDGHTESLKLNGAGGLSLATSAGAGCLSWYPPGHVFSEAERRAAVADYASRLGLSQPGKAPHAASCSFAAEKAAAAPPPAPSRKSRHDAAQNLSAQNGGQNSGPILVRTSVVHPIDAPAAIAAVAQTPIQTPIRTPAQTSPQPSPQMMAATAQPASWSAVGPKKSADVPAEIGKGASDCLSVESDGANLGFRNQCGYGVSFAYCLQTSAETDASCGAASKTGDVAANGFTAVVFDANIRPADAEHDFRWVACSGRAGDVTATLDRYDPPAGRCVRTKSS